MSLEILSLIVLILLSAFFSSTEMAYLVSNKIKLEIKSRKNNYAALSGLYFIKNPTKFFSTILIGNNIVNITFASVSAVLFFTLYNWNDWTILIVSTIIILIFGELIPKYIARDIGDSLYLYASIPLRFLSILFAPVTSLISLVTFRVSDSTNLANENLTYLFTKEDLQDLVKEGQEAGNVTKSDSNLIQKVMDLKEQRVYESMRPRTEIVGVDINASVSEVIDVFIESGFSKLPVFEDNIDNIRGFIIAYDLFKFPENLQTILREMLFVPESKRSVDMLDSFLEKGVSIAIVVDEFGGTAGIVAIEDIIEELFGEIKDEYDTDENICKKTGENVFIINGKVEIDYINEQFEVSLPQGEYETIGGLISSNIGRIPLTGESIQIEKYKFFIIRANQIRIELVRLTIEKEE